MEVSDSPTIMDWLLGLPISAALGIAIGYALIMGIKWFLDYLNTKAQENPEEALRNDLMAAHREVRREVQELRRELSEAYDKMRNMTVELHRIREGLAAIKVELHHLKTEYPASEEVLGAVIERLDSVGIDHSHHP
jgi:predicted nuclease with TOPRIM domain